MPGSGFEIKDSGERQSFAGGMVRDTTEGKINFLSVRFGPMFRRWADHLTKGRAKYPDASLGTPNWTLAQGAEEYLRAKESAARHFESWLAGERDEDHAAGVFFNINLAEFVLTKLPFVGPGLGATVDVASDDDSEIRPDIEDVDVFIDETSDPGWAAALEALQPAPVPSAVITSETPMTLREINGPWRYMNTLVPPPGTVVSYDPATVDPTEIESAPQERCGNRFSHGPHIWRSRGTTGIAYCRGRVYDQT